MLDLAVVPTPEGPVVKVHGDVDGAGAVELDRQLRDLLGRFTVVALELGDLGALSAPGLAVLVDLVSDYRASGAELRVVGARETITRLLERAAATGRPEAAPVGPTVDLRGCPEGAAAPSVPGRSGA